jgi:glycerol-3-phosphate dehydrogenase (NAD(P)+)
MKISVLGAGAWGTALAHHLAGHHDTVLWARNAQLVTALARDRHNAVYLPNIILAPSLRYEADLKTCLVHARAEDALCLIATPISGLRALCQAMGTMQCIPAHLVWLCKGLEKETHHLPHQVITTVLGAHSGGGALSGPSFAHEVALGLPVALTIASRSSTCRDSVIAACHHGAMRIYTSDDIIGVELGGAIKNVLAIATGLADGLQLGLNARAALITRGLAEMTRLGVALGAKKSTFNGLTGIGDLILTATGHLSRNRTVGLQLAQGIPLAEITATLGHVAEGVHSAKTVAALARAHGVDMPIIEAVCAVLFHHCAARAAVHALLSRSLKSEY